MASERLIAIYDFEFFPYALGDVLTWNIRTAMRCEELGREHVDIYICADGESPASIYQRGLINSDNFELFFSELYGAFGTNPRLGNIFIFRQRSEMLVQLQKVATEDQSNLEVLTDYLAILENKMEPRVLTKIWTALEKKIHANPLIRGLINRYVPQELKQTVSNTLSHEAILNKYFIKYIYSHEAINKFAAKRGFVPSLKPSLGCVPDIEEILLRQFKGKKVVTFHLRQRRLDIGYGGEHTYSRDSDFLEWYDFLKMANIKYPEVQFVALGRLQEKPLEILRLPNVVSLRTYGMGLGHELTLMLKSDLFIGSSSGFAALANFSSLPYFITKMNAGSCQAYDIPYGTERLPFAKENQRLIYQAETAVLLMDLLERGLNLLGSPGHSSAAVSKGQQINISEWLKLHLNPYNPSRTTSRFYCDTQYREHETIYLLLPYLEKVRQLFIEQEYEKSKLILNQVQQLFPVLSEKVPEFVLLQGCFALVDIDISSLRKNMEQLELLSLSAAQTKIVALLREYLSILNNSDPMTMNNFQIEKLIDVIKLQDFIGTVEC